MNEGVVHRRHNEVGDSSPSVAPTASKGIGSSDHVLVEEACTPHLAGDESRAKDTNEETADVEACGIRNQRSKANGQCADEQ